MERLGTYEPEREQQSMIIKAKYYKPAMRCLVSLALAVVLALGVISLQAQEAQAKDAPTITVIPFAQGASSADKDLKWVSFAIAEAITADLYNLPTFNTVYVHEWRQNYKGELNEISNRDLFKLGSNLGFDYIVLGEFWRSESGTLRIKIRVADIGNQKISTGSEHEIKIPEMLSFARGITGNITSSLGIPAYDRLAPPQNVKEKAIRENGTGYMKMVLSTLSGRADKYYWKHFKKAVRISPDYKSAWINLGWAHYAAGKYKPSLKAFKQAYELDNQLVDAVAGTGVAHLRLGNLEQGLNYLSKAAMMRPNNKWVNSAYLKETTKTLNPVAIPHLLGLLDSDDLQGRHEAESALDKFNQYSHLPVFFPFINSPSMAAKEYSLKKALMLCDARCVPILRQHINEIKTYADSEEARVRFATVVALGEIGTRAEADLLWNRYNIEPDRWLSLRALASLSFIGDKRAMRVLAEELVSLEDETIKRSIMKIVSRKKERLRDTVLMEHIQAYEARRTRP